MALSKTAKSKRNTGIKEGLSSSNIAKAAIKQENMSLKYVKGSLEEDNTKPKHNIRCEIAKCYNQKKKKIKGWKNNLVEKIQQG